MNRQRSIPMGLVLLVSAALTGCQHAASAPPKGPPLVTYDIPITQTITDYEEFPGQTRAIFDIEVRARVSGYMTRVYFNDGDLVNEGAVLFQIDPRQYKAELDRAEGNVQQIEAHLWRVEKEYHRAKGLQARGSISQEECDRYEADYKETDANLRLAKGNRDLAKLNYDWCEVKAGTSGLCSRRMVDPGNLVKADDSILTNIVSLDPMYVYFDVHEQAMLKIRRLMEEGKIKARSLREVPVKISLSDEAEDSFPHEGLVDFTDNKVDINTGTLQFRAKLPNPDHFITPGLFVRVRLPIGDAHPAIMIREKARVTDQDKNRVWVVKPAIDKEGKPLFANDKDKTRLYTPTPIPVGELGVLVNGYREINEGIEADDWVVVSGMQRLHEGDPVLVEKYDPKSEIETTPKETPKPRKKRALDPAQMKISKTTKAPASAPTQTTSIAGGLPNVVASGAGASPPAAKALTPQPVSSTPSRDVRQRPQLPQ
jgi:membrane fusion protein, multidrug efflux system